MRSFLKALGLMTAGAIVYSVGVWMGYRHRFERDEVQAVEEFLRKVTLGQASYDLNRPKVGHA